MLLQAIEVDPARRRRRQPGATHRRGAAERKRLIDKYEAAFADSPEALGAFQTAVHAAAVWMAARERIKSSNIRCHHEVRMCFDELGKRMTERGHLAHQRQIYMLLADELDDFLADPAVVHRQARRARGGLPRALRARPAVHRQRRGAAAQRVAAARRARRRRRCRSATCCKGVAGSPGEATGRARIMLDLSDPVAARARRHPDRSVHRSVVDTAVPRRRSGRHRHRRRRHARRDRQSRARHPVRAVDRRRHQAHPRRGHDHGQRQPRHGHDRRPARIRWSRSASGSRSRSSVTHVTRDAVRDSASAPSRSASPACGCRSTCSSRSSRRPRTPPARACRFPRPTARRGRRSSCCRRPRPGPNGSRSAPGSSSAATTARSSSPSGWRRSTSCRTGRLIVGLSVGWSKDEHDQMDVDFETRGRRMDELVEALLACWGPDPVEFEGEFFHIPPSIVSPKPLQQPHPPLLSGMRSPPACGARRRCSTSGTRHRARSSRSSRPRGDRRHATAGRCADRGRAADLHRAAVRGARSRADDDRSDAPRRSPPPGEAGIAHVVVDTGFTTEVTSPDDWATFPDRLAPLLTIE